MFLRVDNNKILSHGNKKTKMDILNYFQLIIKEKLTWKFLQRSSNDDDSINVVLVDRFLSIISVLNIVGIIVSFKYTSVLLLIVIVAMINIFLNLSDHCKYIHW